MATAALPEPSAKPSMAVATVRICSSGDKRLKASKSIPRALRARPAPLLSSPPAAMFLVSLPMASAMLSAVWPLKLPMAARLDKASPLAPVWMARSCRAALLSMVPEIRLLKALIENAAAMPPATAPAVTARVFLRPSIVSWTRLAILRVSCSVLVRPEV